MTNMTLTYNAALMDLKPVNESFDYGVLRVAYWGDNRNGTYISKEAFIDALPSIYNCPVVCNYDRDADAIGGHDMIVVKKNNEITLINTTKPVGVVPESAVPYWENIKEEDGSEHEYLCVPILLWKREEAYEHIKSQGVVSESMEITVKSGALNDGIYRIDSFEFTAFCLLESSEPCFESASIEMFSMSDFKDAFARMMSDVKLLYAHTREIGEGGEDEMDDEKKLEVFDAETDTENEAGGNAGADTPDAGQTDATTEEGGEQEGADPAEDDTDDVPADHPARKGNQENYELISHIQHEIETQLSVIRFINPEWHEECERYWMIDVDTDAMFVYVRDRMDGHLYGVPYTVVGDAVNLNIGEKHRVRTVFVDWNDGDTQNYELSDPAVYDAMNRQIAELTEYKLRNEAAIRTAQVSALKEKFSDLADDEKFIEIIGSEMNVADMEDKCYALRGRRVNFSKDDKPSQQTLRVPVERVEQTTEPYGGLFIKYGKTKE